MSANAHFMATCEGGQNPNCIIWNVKEGKRVAAVIPHADGVQCLAFNSEGTMLVTVGMDAHHRLQIIIWDVQLVIIDRIGHNAVPILTGNTSRGLVVAKQLSDFAVTKIYFSPFEENALVSCGRENIRFWRIKKGHMPGRPVQLNEYSRGFIFTEIAFDSDPGPHPIDARRPMAYFASNKGLLIKVDCTKEHVLCAYQLHNGCIKSLSIRGGYAVTGGADCRLRIWPLDFSDFQLEAHHEGAITNIAVTKDGRKLLIGTEAGTLGILDVTEHSYNTVSRSHAGSISAVFARGTNSDEFASLGFDKTIRLWDAVSGQQRFEFTSTDDQPHSAAFDPRGVHHLACGFGSGFLRIFDVDTTSTIFEQNKHSAAIAAVAYGGSLSNREGSAGINNFSISQAFDSDGDSLWLLSSGLDGLIVLYDALRNYSAVRSVSFLEGPARSVHMSVDHTGLLVAVGGESVGTVMVFTTHELSTVYRNGFVNVGVQPTCPPEIKVHAVDDCGITDGIDLGAAIVGTSETAVSAVIRSDIIKNSELAEGAVPPQNSSGLSASLVGMAFAPIVGASHQLLLMTDRHMIGIPISIDSADRSSGRLITKKRSAWDSRCSKRFPYGTACAMTTDPHTGLFFITVKSSRVDQKIRSFGLSTTGVMNTRSVIAGTNTAMPSVLEDADGFIVMSVRVKIQGNGSDRLQFLRAQLYREHSSRVNSICCIGALGKLVSVDSLGCICLWNMSNHNIHLMLSAEVPSPSHLPESETLSRSQYSPGYTPHPITPVNRNTTPRIEISALNIVGATSEYVEGSTAKLTTVSTESTSEGLSGLAQGEIARDNQWISATKGLTLAFEEAVVNDPSAWSAASDKSMVSEKGILSLNDIAVNLDGAKQLTHVVDYQVVSGPRQSLPVSDSNRYSEINDSDNDGDPEPREELVANLTTLPIGLAPPELHLPKVTQPSSQFSELLNEEDGEEKVAFDSSRSGNGCRLSDIAIDQHCRNLAVSRGLKPATEVGASLVSLCSTVPPSFCLIQDKMLVSDGTMVSGFCHTLFTSIYINTCIVPDCCNVAG
jgi:WD40 repeat protein